MHLWCWSSAHAAVTFHSTSFYQKDSTNGSWSSEWFKKGSCELPVWCGFVQVPWSPLDSCTLKRCRGRSCWRNIWRVSHSHHECVVQWEFLNDMMLLGSHRGLWFDLECWLRGSGFVVLGQVRTVGFEGSRCGSPVVLSHCLLLKFNREV